MASFFDRALGVIGLTRKSLSNPSDELLTIFGAAPTSSGVSVTPQSAMRCTAARFVGPSS